MNPGTVIIGGGHAGGSLAIALRQFGYEEPILIIGDESHLPYQRPPLSKAWLKGDLDSGSLLLRPAEWYVNNDITVRLQTTVTAIDALRRRISIGEEELGFDKLVIATGARPRKLEVTGSDLDGVLSLRTQDDAQSIKSALSGARAMVVVGGGYIGLEVAATARGMGVDVTVIEREERLLARVAQPELAAYFERVHHERGTSFRTGQTVSAFLGSAGKLSSAQLSDGTVIPCEIAVVGIGIVPNQELARKGGIATGDGIIVDTEGRTSRPDIFAIGDVTYRPLPHFETELRLESVPSALEQARRTAAAIAGREPPAHEVPWFWSDQFEIKLQMAGITADTDKILLRGSMDENKFALFYLRGNQVRAVEAVNSPAEFMGGKALIATSRLVDLARLSDPAVPMKDLAVS